MRLNFKKDFLLVTAMLVAAGCSDSMTEENNPEQQVPIAFGTQVATRAVVESDKEGMDNFTLWGWVRESDGPKLFSMPLRLLRRETMVRNVSGL